MAVNIRFALAVLIVLAAAVATGAQSRSVLLQKGIYAEETLGDLDAAVKIYEDIVAEAEANRSHVAQAQYRLAMCYLKQGRQAQAAAAFRKVIDQFPTHTAQVTQARTRLAALTEPARIAHPAAQAIRRVWVVVPSELGIQGDVFPTAATCH